MAADAEDGEWCELRNIPARMTPEDLRSFFGEAITNGLFLHFSYLGRRQGTLNSLTELKSSVLGDAAAEYPTAAVIRLVGGGTAKVQRQIKGRRWRTCVGEEIPGLRPQLRRLRGDGAHAPQISLPAQRDGAGPKKVVVPVTELPEVQDTHDRLPQGFVGTPLPVAMGYLSEPQTHVSDTFLHKCGVTRSAV